MTDLENSIIENLDGGKSTNNSINIDNRKSFRISKCNNINQFYGKDDQDEEEKSYREFENNIQVDSMIKRNWNSFHFTRQLKKSNKDTSSTNTTTNTTSNTILLDSRNDHN